MYRRDGSPPTWVVATSLDASETTGLRVCVQSVPRRSEGFGGTLVESSAFFVLLEPMSERRTARTGFHGQGSRADVDERPDRRVVGSQHLRTHARRRRIR